jgi:hypothetical protein
MGLHKSAFIKDPDTSRQREELEPICSDDHPSANFMTPILPILPI